MKKIFVLVLIVALLLTLCACESKERYDSGQTYSYEDTLTFITVEVGDEYRIVYHRETKVMYVISENYSSYGPRAVFTVMLDADGKPLLWEGN